MNIFDLCVQRSFWWYKCLTANGLSPQIIIDCNPCTFPPKNIESVGGDNKKWGILAIWCLILLLILVFWQGPTVFCKSDMAPRNSRGKPDVRILFGYLRSFRIPVSPLDGKVWANLITADLSIVRISVTDV